jgi:hemerythrin-like domain-containing protein
LAEFVGARDTSARVSSEIKKAIQQSEGAMTTSTLSAAPVAQRTIKEPAMDSTNYAALCLMEHQIMQHVKDALRITLAWDVRSVGLARKVSSVQFTMQSLRRHLDRVMNLEEEDGYMNAVRELKPNLYDRAANLRLEHQEFRRTLDYLMPALDKVSPRDNASFQEVCAELCAFLNRIDRHDKQETDLLQAAFYDDIGGEG